MEGDEVGRDASLPSSSTDAAVAVSLLADLNDSAAENLIIASPDAASPGPTSSHDEAASANLESPECEGLVKKRRHHVQYDHTFRLKEPRKKAKMSAETTIELDESSVSSIQIEAFVIMDPHRNEVREERLVVPMESNEVVASTEESKTYKAMTIRQFVNNTDTVVNRAYSGLSRIILLLLYTENHTFWVRIY
jgi:hypothetical protein